MKIFKTTFDRRRAESSMSEKEDLFVVGRFTPEGLAALAMCGVYPRTHEIGVFVHVSAEISRALLDLEDEE